MRWIKFCSAVLAAMSMANLADASTCCSATGACGAAKSCGCASTCQPACCKPVIVRPCCPTVHTYQRRCSDIKPPCCDSCCHNGGCAPTNCCTTGNGCAPACAAPAAACCNAGNGCAPGCAAPAANCVGAPACAAPAAGCAPACAPACAAPAAGCAPACAPACAAPAASCAPACAAPASSCCPSPCGSLCGGGFLKGLFGHHNCCSSSCAPTCGAPASCAPNCGAPAASCTPSCASTCPTRCCNANPCDIAKLIYTSQTACYARQRRAALRKLGNRYDCICNPEIMTAFVYGLNDADERVRRMAADKIGDQIRKNCCCCPEIVAALTCALGDCDRGVRRQAEQALRLCGYDIVDGCCNTCCATACGTTGCAPAAGAAPAATAPVMEPGAPAPVPPQEKTGSFRRGHLSNLLGSRF